MKHKENKNLHVFKAVGKDHVRDIMGIADSRRRDRISIIEQKFLLHFTQEFFNWTKIELWPMKPNYFFSFCIGDTHEVGDHSISVRQRRLFVSFYSLENETGGLWITGLIKYLYILLLKSSNPLLQFG